MFLKRLTPLLLITLLTLTSLTALAQEPLTETYASLDGTLTLNYPAGWAITEQFGTILLASSPEALSSITEIGQIGEGQAVLAVMSPSTLVAQFGMLGIPLDEGPLVVAQSYTAAFGQDTFASPEEIMIGDKLAARAVGVIEGQTQVVYAVDLGDSGIALAALATLSGVEAPFMATTEAIITTLEIEPMAIPTETATVVWQEVREIDAEATTSGGFGGASAVAIGPDDTIYVLDPLAGIHTFDADGAEGDLIVPEIPFANFTVDADGKLWGIDLSGTVTQIDTDGTVLNTFSIGDESGPIGFSTQIDAGLDGNIYILKPSVINPEGNKQTGEILVFNTAGEQVGSFVIGEQDFVYSAQIALDANNRLYVAEQMSQTGVKVFDSEGNLLQENIGASLLFGGAGAIAAAPDGSVYVANTNGTIYHFASDGTLAGEFGQWQFSAGNITISAEEFPPFEPGQFYEIKGMGVLSNGDLIVADANPSYVQVVRVNFSE